MLKRETEFRQNHESIPDRMLAAMMIARALMDYQLSKRVIKKHWLTASNWEVKCDDMNPHEKERFWAGKAAYEWLMNEPLPRDGSKRLTFDDCFQALEDSALTKEDIRNARRREDIFNCIANIAKIQEEG